MSKIEKNPAVNQPGSNEATEESTDKTLTASEQQLELQRENGELKLRVQALTDKVNAQEQAQAQTQPKPEEKQPEGVATSEERLAAIELNQELNDYKNNNNLDDQQAKRILEIVKESSVNIETAHKILEGEKSLQPSDEGGAYPSPNQGAQGEGQKNVQELSDEELRRVGNQANNQG